MTALCPFREKYAAVIREAYPDIELVMGTHLIKGRPANRAPAGETAC